MQTAIYKLKILVGGNLNIINQWGGGGDHKKGVNRVFKVQGGEAKWGIRFLT